MNESGGAVVSVAVGECRLLVASEPPALVGHYRKHAGLVEEFPDHGDRGASGYFFVAVCDGDEWPGLVVAQRSSPSGPGFSPGVLLVPGTGHLFVGAGTRLLGYQLSGGGWRRAWEDETEPGFWGWRQHGDVVLISAELQLAAWSAGGTKLWSVFAEPPWSYQVTDDGQVRLDVMGTIGTFSVRTGPSSQN